MKLYRGNVASIIDLDKIIRGIEIKDVPYEHGYMELSPTNKYYTERNSHHELLTSVGYNPNVVEYRHYKSGVHFNTEIVDVLSNLLKVSPLMCWISRVDPGKCVPVHWDINPWEEQHSSLGKLERFFCFLSKPEFGHIFVTETDAYYMEEQGNVYQYSDTHTLHAGSNVGITSKYLLTLTGYRP